MTTLNVPPHNVESEQVVIGTCLLGSRAISTAVELLIPEVFYKTSHKIIFSIIAEMHKKSINVDTISVMEVLKNKGSLETIGGVSYLAALTSNIPSSLDNHCKIIIDASVKRDVIYGFSEVVEMAYNGSSVTDLLDMMHNTALGINGSEKERPISLAELVPKVFADIEEKSKSKKAVFGIRTGLTDLDRHMGGLQKSNYIVIAGRPGMGKTSLALKFVTGAAKEGEGALVFSMEMKNTRLVSRLISMESRVDGRKLSTGFVAEDDWPRITRSCGVLENMSVIIDHSSALSIAELTSKAKKVSMKMNLGVIVVDYIQLMRGSKGSENRTRELTEISAGLLALAKDLDVAVVVLSQLNRNAESRPDKRPMVSDLKESGSIEQDADVVLLLYRDEVYNDDTTNQNKGIAEIIVGKGRDIGMRTVRVGFNGELTEFHNLAHESF